VTELADDHNQVVAAERAEDVLKGSAVDDQLERSLAKRGQRIANARRSERRVGKGHESIECESVDVAYFRKRAVAKMRLKG